ILDRAVFAPVPPAFAPAIWSLSLHCRVAQCGPRSRRPRGGATPRGWRAARTRRRSAARRRPRRRRGRGARRLAAGPALPSRRAAGRAGRGHRGGCRGRRPRAPRGVEAVGALGAVGHHRGGGPFRGAGCRAAAADDRDTRRDGHCPEPRRGGRNTEAPGGGCEPPRADGVSVAANPTRLTEHSRNDNTTGVDEVLDAATVVANETNTTYSGPSNLGNCIINSIMATVTAANAAIGIRDAVKFCRREGAPPGLCASAITGATTSFIWLGSFLSGAVHTCMGTPDLGADCAEDVMAVVGSLGTTVLAAAQLSYTCPPMSKNISFNGYDPNKTDTFACVIDSIFAANTLANAIQGILNAIKDCSNDPIRPDGLSPSGITIASPHLCAADAVGVAASFQFMGSFTAQAVDNCAPKFNTDALCAADIIEVMAALTAMAGRALRMADDCNPRNLNESRFNPSAATQPSGRVNR
ncbi:unnamed protein product, partial [Prorocentrum cordatum]